VDRIFQVQSLILLILRYLRLPPRMRLASLLVGYVEHHLSTSTPSIYRTFFALTDCRISLVGSELVIVLITVYFYQIN
jgi:hypothetical protein